MNESELIRAGGGIVWRPDGHGSIEVLVVHRPRYDDWSFPKGKADPTDADDLATALREVTEETGLVCRAGTELEPVRYVDRKGRPKVVRYWLMVPVAGELTVNEEVDAMEWVAPRHAVEILSYEHDRHLCDTLIGLDPALLH